MSFAAKAKAAVKWVDSLHWLLKSLAVIVFVGGALVVDSIRSQESGAKPTFPASGPAEFLYLDSGRVIAYLAQFDGGTYTSKELTQKLTDSVNGKVSLDAVELGGNSAQERSLSGQITPTAAGNYIELLTKLEGLPHGLKTIGLGRFEHDVAGLTEGQLVRFQTHALSSPVYLSPYLAVRQHETLSTLYPASGKGRAEREKAHLERASALRLRKQVGKDPRVTFALRPLSEKEREEARRERLMVRQIGGATAASATGRKHRLSKAEKRRRKQEEEEKLREEQDHVQYLMPIDAALLTKERSLIKFGGGEFTVVGKVVRVFPEHGDTKAPAYIDSPTRETWTQPLAAAPLSLLCRADPGCIAGVRKKGLTLAQRRRVARRSRARAIEVLEGQTEIFSRGAVILPIAIYK